MSEGEVAEISKRTSELFDALGVERVVCIDDRIPGGATVEDAVVAAQSLPSLTVAAIFPEMNSHIPEDPDILAQGIRRILKELGEDATLKRCDAVVTAALESDASALEDVGALSMLSNIIEPSRLINLSPKLWASRKDALLNESAQCRTLFLFDRDLSNAGGDVDGGLNEISRLVGADMESNNLFGLITHTVTPENREYQWRAWSDAFSIPRDRFVVIPKSVFSSPSTSILHALKFAVLSRDFFILKRHAKDVILKAAEKAAQRVDDVSVYDLDEIVFRISTQEGLWEPDMLFRLHGCFQRKEALRLAHEGGSLEVVSHRLRKVSSIPADEEKVTLSSSAWALQREELYDGAEELNPFNLPLELGDIFERTDGGGSKRYVLLAQPCDLMVRSDGKRGPELERVPVAELVHAPKHPACGEELPCYDEDCTKHWYVKFKYTKYVATHILDLTVLNRDGRSSMILEAPAPDHLRPPWKARYQYMSGQLKKQLRKCSIAETYSNDNAAVRNYKQQLLPQLQQIALDDGLFKGDITETDGKKTITYNCRRVGRISRHRALGLLLLYTTAMARPAFEVPLVTGLQQTDATDFQSPIQCTELDCELGIPSSGTRRPLGVIDRAKGAFAVLIGRVQLP